MVDGPGGRLTRTPLVFVPGLLCDDRLWQPQVGRLLDVAEPVIADLTAGASVSEMARSVLEAAPSAERFALAGLSMGGYVALEIMRTVPDRVSRLALLDTSARADTAEQTADRRGLIELAESGRFEEVSRRLLQREVHPGRLDDERIVSTVLDMAHAVGPQAFVRQEEAIIGRPDGRRGLPNIACPTLVLCGREDALTPLHLHQEMASLIPDSRLCVIEDCGHLSTIERPEAVAAALREWLAQSGGRVADQGAYVFRWD
ncbi:MAG: alpha/beta hydrolase [Actinomycetota bacterium]|nr:alpha/beta hydrolase [Actinomycetota bacterium]